MLISLGLSLAVTLLSELPLAWLLGLRKGRELAVAALMNVMTNPPLVFTANLTRLFLPPGQWRLLVLGLELAAFAAEALVLRLALERSWRRSLAGSAALNLGSYLAGALVSGLL